MICPCSGSPFRGRSEAGWSLILGGLDLLEPGLVAVSEWRADDEVPGSAHALGRRTARPGETQHDSPHHRRPRHPRLRRTRCTQPALFAHNIETGLWDDQGRVAPWPDDIDEWTRTTDELHTPEPGQPPF